MKRVIALLLLIILFVVSSTAFAQATRESTHTVQPSEPAAPTVDDRIHIVQYGEILSIIAQHYGVDLYDLMRHNGLFSHVIYPGHVLRLPSTEVETAVVEVETIPLPASGQHIVKRGETLSNIAAAYEINLNELIIENGIFNHIIYPGQVLILPGVASAPVLEEPVSDPEPEVIETETVRSHVSYWVRFGDTLGEIAGYYGTTLTSLMQANDIFYPHLIYVGQQLRIPASTSVNLPVAIVESWPAQANAVEDDSPPADDIQAVEENVQESEVTTPAPEIFTPPEDHFPHTVQFRETLSVIAKHYGVSMIELMSANGIVDADRIDQGQTIWIPPTAITREPPAAPVAPIVVSTSEAASTTVAPGGREIYVVQRGEILSIIGNKLGMNWVVIAEVNGLANPNRLHAGMELLVPNADDLAKYPASYGSNRFNLYSDDPGAHVGVGREFVVVLSTQRAYAYEDGVLKKAALVSTGLPATPTVQGNYRIYLKRRSQSMSGPGYDLDNVEWVMFFHRGYAFHGTWWHNNFGQPMSHGCVNMTNPDARWFYEFGSIGTPVHVRYY